MRKRFTFVQTLKTDISLDRNTVRSILPCARSLHSENYKFSNTPLLYRMSRWQVFNLPEDSFYLTKHEFVDVTRWARETRFWDDEMMQCYNKLRLIMGIHFPDVVFEFEREAK